MDTPPDPDAASVDREEADGPQSVPESARGVHPAERRRRDGFLVLAALTFAAFALLRLHTFHNRTFDLAFYARMAWGWAHFQFWDPFLDAHVLGEHVSPVLLPLGWLGMIFGSANVLLVAQAVAAAIAAGLLGRMAHRRLVPLGLSQGYWLGAAGLLLHPNLPHVLTYEAHPGTLALAPLAWLVERVDAGDARGALLATLGVLACREDLALLTAMAGLVAMTTAIGPRRGALLAALSITYLALFVFWLHPTYAPSLGSFDLHFGRWGDTPGEAVRGWLSDPSDLFAHLGEHRNLTYLPRVMLPLLLLPLLAPRWLLVAAPVLAINLVSTFPTTPNLDSHYLTPALPAIVGAAIAGLARLPEKLRPWALPGAVLATTVAVLWVGPRPWHQAYWPDARTDASRKLLTNIEAGSVQAPDPLLAHLAERPRVHRAPPPDRGADQVVLDVSHRARYAGQESLLRTIEEPLVRAWLARAEYGVVAHEPPWLLLRRGADPRARLERSDQQGDGQALCGCLALLAAQHTGGELALHLQATGPCPDDLALRFDDGSAALLFGGEVGPRHLRAGDRVVSRHRHARPTTVQAIRSSGAPPEPGDVPVPL